MSKNKKNPNRPKKRRNPRKIVTKRWSKDDIARVAKFSKGSVHDQEGCERQLQEALAEYGNTDNICEPSASKRKIDWASSTPCADQNTETEEVPYTPVDNRFEKFSHKWIVDLAELSNYVGELTVCKSCHSDVELVEENNF